MAGRGTDILLDPDLDSAIAARCAEVVSKALDDGASEVTVDCDTAEDANTLEAAFAHTNKLQLSRDDMVVDVSRTVDLSSPAQSASMAFGCGLRVIGTEMNDSGRVDAQLRGRAGRQGSAGSSAFVLSLEDRFLASSGVGELPSDDAHMDVEGRPFFAGEATTRALASEMSWVERDTEAGRTIMSDYQRVLEEQTLAYYEARRDIIADDRFHIACIALAKEAAARMVERHFQPASGVYADRFDSRCGSWAPRRCRWRSPTP
jgi:preprotein translocase subunit SecA